MRIWPWCHESCDALIWSCLRASVNLGSIAVSISLMVNFYKLWVGQETRGSWNWGKQNKSFLMTIHAFDGFHSLCLIKFCRLAWFWNFEYWQQHPSQVLSCSHLRHPLCNLLLSFHFLYFFTAIGCQTLRNPLNGKITISSTTTNSTAKYECNRGFRLLGDSTLVCQSNGHWKGVVAVCEGTKDNAPFT